MQLLAVQELLQGMDGSVWSYWIFVLPTPGKAVVPVQQVRDAFVSGEKSCNIVNTASR